MKNVWLTMYFPKIKIIVKRKRNTSTEPTVFSRIIDHVECAADRTSRHCR